MALQITITDAGRAEIINAQNTGTAPVTLTEIGFGTGQYSPTKTQTTLQSEVKRVSSIGGQAVTADTIHVTAKDEGADAYNVGEFGLYSGSGTLIAVYSQPAEAGWVLQKAGASTLLLAVDIILESLDATSLTFGDVIFINPPATTEAPGVVQLNDTLTSSSTSQALTAAQGKKLQDEKQPKAANLTSLAGLYGAADRLPYFTGAGALSLAVLTAAARDLLAASDKAGQRTALGLGSAAVKNTGTSGDAVPLLNAANSWGAQQKVNDLVGLGADNFRRVNAEGTYGSFWRMDAANLYLLLTNNGDPYGSYNAYRPLMIGLANGRCDINGNANTANKLATARTINGVNFDGSANITVADSTKLPLTGGAIDRATGAISGGGAQGQLEIQNGASAGSCAGITFHRRSSYAFNFGMDTDNKLKVGGYSMGAVAYEIFHDGNAASKKVGSASYADTVDSANVRAHIASFGAGEVGTYGFFLLAGGGGVTPGTTIAGSNLKWANASGAYVGGAPAGTWRIMGQVLNADGASADSTTLCLRIS